MVERNAESRESRVESQREWDFDGESFRRLVDAAECSGAMKKLMRAIITWGREDPRRIPAFDGASRDDEWMVAPSLAALALAAGVARDTVQGWVRQVKRETFAFFLIDVSEGGRADDTHQYLIRWAAMRDNFTRCKRQFHRVETSVAPGEDGEFHRVETSVSPGEAVAFSSSTNQDQRRRSLTNQTRPTPATPRSGAPAAPLRGVATTLRSAHFTSPFGVENAFREAVKSGLVGASERANVFALCVWIGRQGWIENKPGFLIARLNEPQHRRLADVTDEDRREGRRLISEVDGAR